MSSEEPLGTDGRVEADGRATEKDRVRLINRIIGKRYEVLECVGEGPLLTAFRSRDQQLNRIVTLKTLRSELQGRASLIENLKAGFSEILTLQQAGIARAYDVGSESEGVVLYYAEEFVRGIDLKERIRRAAPFQLTGAVDIAITVAEALEYAHGHGIAHGDICPQNILVGPEGQIKLTGFGMAPTYTFLASEDPSLLMRIAHYAAPDLSTTAMPTASGDLYALAIVLFEMLTGEPPFKGDNPVTIALRHAQEIPPSPRSLNQAIPRALEGIILKALAKRPQDRYHSASELLADLRQVREALRFGRSLAWSPLDVKDATAEKTPSEATVPATVGVLPIVTDTAAEPGRRISRPVEPEMPVTTREKARRGSDEDSSPAPPPRRTGGVLLAINLLLLLALVGSGALVFNWIRPFLAPANEVVIPELRGKSLTEAKALANERRFKLVVEGETFRDDKPSGVIYDQKELADGKKRIVEGKEIYIWVSKGPEMVLVPNVEETTLDKAQKDLEKAGLKVGETTRRFDPITPAGVVLEQLPRGDGMERRARGTKVDLVLSKGQEPEPTPAPTPEPTPEPRLSENPTPEAGLPDPEDTRQRTFRIPYKVPQDGQQHHIIIQVEDTEGTHTGYEMTHEPGKSFTAEVTGIGRPITIKLYDNDDLRAQTTPVKGR
jgi:eukaryotic-like serine/threonine-protein kinase